MAARHHLREPVSHAAQRRSADSGPRSAARARAGRVRARRARRPVPHLERGVRAPRAGVEPPARTRQGRKRLQLVALPVSVVAGLRRSAAVAHPRRARARRDRRHRRALCPARRDAGGAGARAALRLSGSDVAVLSDIDPESVFACALERASMEAGRASLPEISERVAYVDLPASWGEYLQSLTSDRRTRVKSARKKAGAAHKVRFFVWDDAANLDHAIDRLVALHRSRWRAAGGSGSFASAEYIEFHRQAMKSAFGRGWLRLYCLELDGEIAAITYCYRFRNRIYLMQAGFDPALAKSNPGKVLLGHALEHAIGEGSAVFDFLKGEHRYKDQLATGYRNTRGVRVFRNTPGGIAYRLRRIWLPQWKARLLRRPAPKLMT